MSDRRTIATKWTCQRDGTCCMVSALVVTHEELAAMQAAKPTPLETEVIDSRFVRIVLPKGCPYLTRELNGKAGCSIYESRPTNCRRFQCLRPDVTVEPFEYGGPMGCRNLSDRIEQSLHALTFYQANERRAMKAWGHAHGWHK